MPSKNIVREIKAENIKDINPSDIIYLALKDGSILLVIDNDDDIIDYDDININFKEKSTRKRTNLSYNNDKSYKNKYQNQYNTNTSYTKVSYNKTNIDKNSEKNKYTSNQKDKEKQTYNISTSNFVDRRQHKQAVLSNKGNNNQKMDNYANRYIINKEKEKENLNKDYNYNTQYNNRTNRTNQNMSNYKRSDKADKSFDTTNNTNKYGNQSVYKRDNIPNKDNNRYHSYKKDEKPPTAKVQYNSNYRNNNNNNENNRVKITSYSSSKTPIRNDHKGFIFESKNNNNNNSIINISNLSNKNEKSFVNKTKLVEKKNIYKEALKNNNKNNSDNGNYTKVNYFKRGEQVKTQISSNRSSKTPTNKYIERKEYEIMGRIVNNDKSIKLVDHNHPNTLYDRDCKYCKNLAKNNKLCLSNFTEESIQDNHGFHVSFGNSSQKEKGKYQSKFAKNYKKVA
jgi:hypothetical protein